MVVKKKKKATRKKSSKIVEQSNNSNEIIEKIKANPLIALIGIVIVVGIGIFIYSSQQGTQIALNKCINKNLDSNSNKDIDEHLISLMCVKKFQKEIPLSKVKIKTHEGLGADAVVNKNNSGYLITELVFSNDEGEWIVENLRLNPGDLYYENMHSPIKKIIYVKGVKIKLK